MSGEIKTDLKSFSCSKAKNFILIACNKDLFRPKIIIFLLNMLWEICCHIFRETKNWKFKETLEVGEEHIFLNFL
jgi:hypothetical protein